MDSNKPSKIKTKTKHPPKSSSPNLNNLNNHNRNHNHKRFLLTIIFSTILKSITPRKALTFSTLYCLLVFHATSKGIKGKLRLLNRYTFLITPISSKLLLDPSHQVITELFSLISSFYLSMGLLGFLTLLTNSKSNQSKGISITNHSFSSEDITTKNYINHYRQTLTSTSTSFMALKNFQNIILFTFVTSHTYRAIRLARLIYFPRPWKIYKLNIIEILIIEGILASMGACALINDIL